MKVCQSEPDFEAKTGHCIHQGVYNCLLPPVHVRNCHLVARLTLTVSWQSTSQLLSMLLPNLLPIKMIGHLPDLSHVWTDVNMTASPQKCTKCAKGCNGESAALSLPEGGGSASSPTTCDSFGFGPSEPPHLGSVVSMQLCYSMLEEVVLIFHLQLHPLDICLGT